MVIMWSVVVRWWRYSPRVSREKVFMSALVFSAAFFAAIYANQHYLRFFGNSLYWNLTLGPCELGAHCELLYLKFNPADWFFGPVGDSVVALIVVVTLWLFALGINAAVKMRDSRGRPHTRLAAFALLALIGTLTPFAMFNVFDRYIIPLFPFFALLLVASGSLLLSRYPEDIRTARFPLARILSASILLVFGFLAVCGTHDYLAWNRARWLAVSDLIDKHSVAAGNIEGGFAVTGWNLYATDKVVRGRFNEVFADANKFTVPSARYVVGFDNHVNLPSTCEQTPSSGQAKLVTYPISGWLLRPDLEIAVYMRCSYAHE
jgi:hypothetical protein